MEDLGRGMDARICPSTSCHGEPFTTPEQDGTQPLF
jgi:hypothetical protein